MAPPVLMRANSAQTEPVGEKRDEDGQGIPEICYINPHALLDICRTAAGGAVSDLEQDFLDRCLYSSGIVLMRVGAVLDKSAKKLECVAQQIAFSGGRVETGMSVQLRAAGKKGKRPATSTMPYLFNQLDFHIVSRGEVWKYNRALEGYTQPISVAVTSRPKKVGRKRMLDTLTATAAQEAFNYDDINNIDELEDLNIGENEYSVFDCAVHLLMRFKCFAV